MARRGRSGLVAVVCLVALFAAACGTGKDEGSGGSTQSTGAGTNITVDSSGTPKPGGQLIFGLEAETDGFNPTKDRWAISGTEIGLAVFDPLVAFDADNTAQPYLAQSITPSPDFKEWTITVRPQITFHDGTPLSGAAIATMFNAHLQSALTRPALAPIESATASGDLSCVVKMKTPWVTFPDALTSQLGMVPAPSMFNPDGTPTEGGGMAPVGTGPFRFKSWSPGQPFDATRNDSYWRKDSSGTQLPYLGSIEFQVIPDGNTRTSAVRTGDVTMTHTSDPQEIVTLREQAKNGTIQLVEDSGEGEEDFLIVNTQDPALKDVRVRKAMALALDRDTLQHDHQRRHRRGRRRDPSSRARSGTRPPTTRASTSPRPSSSSTSTRPTPATRRPSPSAPRRPRPTTRSRSSCSRCSRPPG